MLWALINIALKISGLGLHGIASYYRAAKNSSDWPCVPGELLKCELVEQAKANATVYGLEVKYSYRIEGEALESSHIMFYLPQWSTCRPLYVRLQAALTAQGPLSVYVNPQNPGESVLFPGVEHVPVWLLPTAIMMMLVCPTCFVIAIHVLFLA